MMHFHPLIFDVQTTKSVNIGGVKRVVLSCGFLKHSTRSRFHISHVVEHVAHKLKGL